jgi:hypothetical protein
MKGSRVPVMRLGFVLTTLVSLQWICRAETSDVSFPPDDVHPRSLALKSFGKITGPTRIRSRNNTNSQQPHTHSSASSGSLSRYGSASTAIRAWQDIYIAGFFALSEHEIEAALGQGVMPAIKLALQHVANTSFLHDYRLHLLHNDTKVTTWAFLPYSSPACIFINKFVAALFRPLGLERFKRAARTRYGTVGTCFIHFASYLMSARRQQDALT